jgi:hypothetical protein
MDGLWLFRICPGQVQRRDFCEEDEEGHAWRLRAMCSEKGYVTENKTDF